MPEWIQDALRVVTTVSLLTVMVMLVRNDRRIRETRQSLRETAEAQEEIRRTLDRRCVVAVLDEDGPCRGPVQRRVLMAGINHTVSTCEGHAELAVILVRAMDGVEGEDR